MSPVVFCESTTAGRSRTKCGVHPKLLLHVLEATAVVGAAHTVERFAVALVGVKFKLLAPSVPTNLMLFVAYAAFPVRRVDRKTNGGKYTPQGPPQSVAAVNWTLGVESELVLLATEQRDFPFQ